MCKRRPHLGCSAWPPGGDRSVGALAPRRSDHWGDSGDRGAWEYRDRGAENLVPIGPFRIGSRIPVVICRNCNDNSSQCYLVVVPVYFRSRHSIPEFSSPRFPHSRCYPGLPQVLKHTLTAPLPVGIENEIAQNRGKFTYPKPPLIVDGPCHVQANRPAATVRG